ncbi:hypothetical protein BGZ83_001438 [Gryganskiella cystojenkinii]|nr:hypothetical protein BGZ83_001438 [Gryganskiella cystojenkinii]
MISSPLESDRPVFRAIVLPHIVDAICLPLSPQHICSAVLVSKDFHNAFLAYRWRVLDSLWTKNSHPNNHIPFFPSPKVESALVRYGLGFARHVVLMNFHNTLSDIMLREATSCTRLISIKQVGKDRGVKNILMHWDEDDDDHKSFYDTEHADPDPGATPTSLYNTALTLAVQSQVTLRTLHLEGVIRSRLEPNLVFSAQLINALSVLENLGTLVIGDVFIEDVIYILMHLPSRLKDLSLAAFEEDFSPAMAERQRRHRVTQVRKAAGFFDLREDETEVKALLATMPVHTQLMRLRLSEGIYPYHWVLHEILRRCPNLNTITLPFLGSQGVDMLSQVLREEGVCKISHLDLTESRYFDDDYGPLMSCFLPQGHHKQDPPELTSSQDQNHDQLSARLGLISLTIDSSVPPSLTMALSAHYPTLERFAIVQTEFPYYEDLDSRDVLAVLQGCPRLDTFLVLGHTNTRPKQSTIRVLDFVLSGNNFSDDRCGFESLTLGDTEEQELPPQEQQEIQRPPLPQPRNLELRTCPWRCVQTLRVLALSLEFDGDSVYIGEKDIPLYFGGFYHTLGQLEALEDLALGCDLLQVGFNPWPGHPTANYDDDYPSASRSDVDGDDDYVYVGLDLSLVQGLGYMHKLKRLKRMDVSRVVRPRIGREEVEWMNENWPRFESLMGVSVKGTKFE